MQEPSGVLRFLGQASLIGTSVIDNRLVPARDICISACVNVLRDIPRTGLRRPRDQLPGERLVPACVPGQRRREFGYRRSRSFPLCLLQGVNRPGISPEDLPEPLDDPSHQAGSCALTEFLHSASSE